jgi:acetoin utilization protein AcuB
MLVRDRMTPNPITIVADAAVSEALDLMTRRSVRRLPVVDKGGRLIGIVSEKELLHASPSPVTALNVYEVKEMLHLLTINKIMGSRLITVEEDAPLEEAAVLMAANKVGGLPVTCKGSLTGMITETDIFKSFLELLGSKRPGVRISVITSGARGVMAKIANAIFECGGNIVGLGMIELKDSIKELWEVTFKIQGATKEELLKSLRPLVQDVVDLRDQCE